jgi:hypothetical protein
MIAILRLLEADFGAVRVNHRNYPRITYTLEPKYVPGSTRVATAASVCGILPVLSGLRNY